MFTAFLFFLVFQVTCLSAAPQQHFIASSPTQRNVRPVQTVIVTPQVTSFQHSQPVVPTSDIPLKQVIPSFSNVSPSTQFRVVASNFIPARKPVVIQRFVGTNEPQTVNRPQFFSSPVFIPTHAIFPQSIVTTVRTQEVNSVHNQGNRVQNQVNPVQNPLNVVHNQVNRVQSQVQPVKNLFSSVNNQVNRVQNHVNPVQNPFNPVQSTFNPVHHQVNFVQPHQIHTQFHDLSTALVSPSFEPPQLANVGAPVEVSTFRTRTESPTTKLPEITKVRVESSTSQFVTRPSNVRRPGNDRPLEIHEEQVPVTRPSSRLKPVETFVTELTNDEERHRQDEEARYSFSAEVNDSLSDAAMSRQETREGGVVQGSYSYSDGFYRRTVHYRADSNGYQIVNEQVEPLGDGPRPNPDGEALINVQSSAGISNRYRVSATDLKQTEDSDETEDFVNVTSAPQFDSIGRRPSHKH